ncbi:MAG TPA: hypothetical protein PKC47_00980 [Petrimonas sp.]|nr:hypothetical protein [Petrimonas sp.]
MVFANRNRDFHYRNDGFLTPEYWLSSTGRVALKVRTDGSNRAGILNYCEDSIIVTQDGVIQGMPALRQFFKSSMENCFPAGTKWESVYTQIYGEMAYTVWKAESELCVAPFGTDTFIIRNGKIIQQSFAGIIEKKD